MPENQKNRQPETEQGQAMHSALFSEPDSAATLLPRQSDIEADRAERAAKRAEEALWEHVTGSRSEAFVGTEEVLETPARSAYDRTDWNSLVLGSTRRARRRPASGNGPTHARYETRTERATRYSRNLAQAVLRPYRAAQQDLQSRRDNPMTFASEHNEYDRTMVDPRDVQIGDVAAAEDYTLSELAPRAEKPGWRARRQANRIIKAATEASQMPEAGVMTGVFDLTAAVVPESVQLPSSPIDGIPLPRSAGANSLTPPHGNPVTN